MLRYLRENTGNWIIKLFLGIIVIVFVFLGVGSFGSKRNDSIATINDEPITIKEYQQAYKATAMAHYEGGVPNMSIMVPRFDAHSLGQLYYFFERAVAITGYLMGVNPFDQPGVEAYKTKMFELLGRN